MLRDELLRENFRLAGDDALRAYTATFAPPNLPCHSLTRIAWSEDRRGRITRITAERHDCT